jgi:hypothetical protein
MMGHHLIVLHAASPVATLKWLVHLLLLLHIVATALISSHIQITAAMHIATPLLLLVLVVLLLVLLRLLLLIV